MDTYSLIRKGHEFLVQDSDGIELADIRVLKADAFEKGHAFIYTQHSDDQSMHVGIKKGRLLFAQYDYQVRDHSYSLQDHKGKSLIYYAVSGIVDGKMIYIEEDWDGGLELKVDKEKIAKLNPFPVRKGAELTFISGKEQDVYLPLLTLFYFMFQIYKKEVAFVEDLIEEAL
ncbi:hypothetical protein NSQ54_19600 [Alkalihalobacillus sp. FSL W8-0930]